VKDERNWRLGGGVTVVGAIAVVLLFAFFDRHAPIWSSFLTLFCVGVFAAAFFGQRHFERHWRDVGDADSPYRGDAK
jgi:hypothetical protein